MNPWYETSVLIDSRDVDGMGRCKASALLGHLQEAATQAAETRGFGRLAMQHQHHGVWILSRVWYQLCTPLLWSQTLTIRTWHRGGQTASLYRDYDLFLQDQWVGQCVSLWVLFDPGSHHILRLSQVPQLAQNFGGSLCKSKRLTRISLPSPLPVVEERLMHYSDTDINCHVNNTRYADFVCDALDFSYLDPHTFLQELQISYLAQCHPGDLIQIRGTLQGTQGFVLGVDSLGLPRFEASVSLGTLDPSQRIPAPKPM